MVKYCHMVTYTVIYMLNKSQHMSSYLLEKVFVISYLYISAFVSVLVSYKQLTICTWENTVILKSQTLQFYCITSGLRAALFASSLFIHRNLLVFKKVISYFPLICLCRQASFYASRIMQVFPSKFRPHENFRIQRLFLLKYYKKKKII